MVKPPRIRHSRSGKDPVTIDLSPGDMSRVKAEAEDGKAPVPPKPSDAPGAGGEAKTAKESAESASSATGPAVGSGGSTQARAGTDDRKSSGPEAKPAEPAKEPAKPSTQADKSAAPPPKEAARSPSGPSAGSGTPAAAGASAAAGGATQKSAFGRADPAARPAPPPGPARGRAGALGAGVAGGVVALLLAGGLQWAGLLPTPAAAPATAPDEIAALEGEVAELRQAIAEIREAGPTEAADPAEALAEANARVDTLAASLETLQGELDAVRAAVAEAAPDGVAPDLSPIEARLVSLETALSQLDAQAPDTVGLDALGERVATLESEIAAISDAASASTGRIEAFEQSVAALVSRLEAVEQSVEGFAGRLDEGAELANTALVIAGSALRSAVDRGVPFAGELDTIEALAPEIEGIDELRAFAATGVPTRAQILAESDAAAAAMINAGREIDPEAGLLDRLWGSAQGLVAVRPIGMVEGEDVPAIVARIATAVSGDDYARALSEFESLPEAAQTAGRGFIERVRARHAADDLVARVLAAALKA